MSAPVLDMPAGHAGACGVRSARASAQARADGWAGEAAPMIRAWLALGPVLDALEPACAFFDRASPAERAAGEAYLSIERARTALHERIGAYRDAAIDRAHPLHGRPGARFDAQDAIDIADALVADTIALPDAIRVVEGIA